ncbi:MAG: acyltransferase [Gammaproteobacteria bacterium]|nr:acyltransferase [Gammaproteobacteria bacterium]
MGIWSQASALAAKTPETRNRYVDFLRAVSILLVISGHWLIATAWYQDGELVIGDMLNIQPWTQWLSWLFQVMPVFFIVGGYSNAVSLESARRRNVAYAGWLTGRLFRLVSPLILLLVAWALLTVALNVFGVKPANTRMASQAALIPIWFLAIYTMVVMLAPLTYRLWRRWGYWSFAASAAVAVLVDVAFFAADLRWPGWSNYFWIWLAVHQLGYAWRDGRVGKPPMLMACALAALTVLLLMVLAGPYPIAMAGSPDESLSNTLPPKITLLALGVTQFCLLLAGEKPVQRWLDRLGPWTATVLINSMIMTIYLWHMTGMIVVVAVAYLAGGIGLTLEPGSPEWWWSRPLWIAFLAAILVPLALVLSALERRSLPPDRPEPSTPRLIVGAMMICLGVALTASMGFDGVVDVAVDAGAFALVMVGALLSGLVTLRR